MAADPAPARPSVLVIHTDEQVFDTLGCLGHPDVRTPNLDRLAAEGTLFTRAYACNGVCVPSRACLMTGRYPIAHGVTSLYQPLPPGEPTMGKLFRAAGYATGYFGKSHHGVPEAKMGEDGWQETFLPGKAYPSYLEANGVAARYPEKKEIRRADVRYWNVGASRIPAEHYFENVIARKAEAFLRAHAAEPFLCFVGNLAPHGPFTPPRPYDALYDPAKLTLAPRDARELEGKPAPFVRWVTQNRKYVNDAELRVFLAHYYALITLVDENVGRLVKALKETGAWDRTVVVFTSDHGDFASAYGILGKSWCMDDRLLRTPLVISHPARRKAARNASLVENVDVLPTLLDAAGIAVPARMQGRSLAPIAMGKADSVKEAAFAYNEHADDDTVLRQSMAVRGKWKLVVSPGHADQLFDLEADPHEFRNRAAEPACRATLGVMRDLLLGWHAAHSGGFYDPGAAGFWERRVNFYDEARFSGG
jgi:uncharacterized sulfatase